MGGIKDWFLNLYYRLFYGRFYSFVKAVLPASGKNFVRYLFRTRNRLRFKKNKAAGKSVSREEIVSGLRGLGIRKGDTLMVHSSLSSFGNVEGGADAVIDALLEAVGPQGNVCMPCLGTIENNTFFAEKTPASTGKIAETFRKRPEAKRSLSPIHSVACIGKDAEYICKGHELDRTSFGKHSPYFKMLEFRSWLLVLGSYLGQVTQYHLTEDLMGKDFPVRVYADDSTEFTVVSAGKRFKVRVLNHTKDLRPRKMSHNRVVGREMRERLLEAGHLKQAKIGDAEVLAIRISELHEDLKRLAGEGFTIYGNV
jgi:aminoglycoside 3-N-acetyltransferase